MEFYNQLSGELNKLEELRAKLIAKAAEAFGYNTHGQTEGEILFESIGVSREFDRVIFPNDTVKASASYTISQIDRDMEAIRNLLAAYNTYKNRQVNMNIRVDYQPLL